jgi:hypothetical protein
MPPGAVTAAIMGLAMVGSLLGTPQVFPVLYDPLRDPDGRKMTVLTFIWQKLVTPAMGEKTLKDSLSRQPGYASRGVTPVEKAWLVSQNIVAAHTPNLQIVLVPLSCLLSALTAAGFPPHMLQGLQAAVGRWECFRCPTWRTAP